MKQITKLLFSTALAVYLFLQFPALAKAQSLSAPYISANISTEISPRSDLISWRYLFINGIAYRRLYDYTHQCWIGEWELCP